MTDDRNDDILDSRIRSLVATAVADAPPAPEIDETTIRTTSATGVGADGNGGDRRWIAGGLAGVSVAAAIVALFVISRPEEVSSPVIPATQPPTIAATTPEPVDEPVDELTEDPAVEVDSTDAIGPSAAQVLYLSEDGVLGVDEDGEVRTITAEAMAAAVLLDDGRIFAQRATGTVPVFEPPILVIDQGSEDLAVAPLPAAFDGLTPFLHDSALIDGQAVVLLTLRPEACAGGAGCIGQLVAWWPDTDEVRVVAERNVFEGGWRLPTLADNGLVVGIEVESATHGFFAAAVPGVAGVDVPSAAELGLDESYFDCQTCPDAFTTDASGQVVAWLETDATSGDLSIAMRSEDQTFTTPISGFDDESPPASRSQLLMPFAGFDFETGEPFGSFALASDVIGGDSGAWFGSLLDGTVEPLADVDRLIFP